MRMVDLIEKRGMETSCRKRKSSTSSRTIRMERFQIIKSVHY